MRVISVSRRTDIPAFYSEWLMRRVRAGFACSRNPFNPKQISTVSLQPEKVACLVFWTKDPRPLLPHLPDLDRRRLRSIFHITLTGLPEILEPQVPAPHLITNAMRDLSEQVGPDRVIWRFDPIVLGGDFPSQDVVDRFERMASELHGAVNTVKISFLQRYRQVTRRLQGMTGISDLDTGRKGLVPEEVARCAAAMRAAADRHGLVIESCAERFDLKPYGIAPGRCLDASMLKRLFGLRLDPRKDPGQRDACGCIRSVDIGVYGTCRHGCRYCYASTDRALDTEVHDPDSPLLFGRLPENRRPGSLF